MKLEKVIEMILEKSSTQEQIVENILTLIELEKYKQIRDLYQNLPLNRHLDRMDLYDGENGEWDIEIECYEANEVDRLLDEIEKLFLSSGYDSLISSYELLLENNLK